MLANTYFPENKKSSGPKHHEGNKKSRRKFTITFKTKFYLEFHK